MAFVECRERELQIHSHNFLCLLRRAKLPERKLCTMRYRHHHSPRSLALHSLHNGARTNARAKEKMQIKVRENKKAINNLDWDGWWLEIMQQKQEKKATDRLWTHLIIWDCLSPTAANIISSSEILHFTYFIIYERQRRRLARSKKELSERAVLSSQQDYGYDIFRCTFLVIVEREQDDKIIRDS